MFSGSITALATPFNKSGEVCIKTYKKLVKWQLAQGSDGIVVAGCTGENFTLHQDEKDEMLKASLDAARGKFSIIMGTGSAETAAAIEQTKRAKKIGADGALVITPFGNKPSQKAMIAHYNAIANIGLPIILYNVPSRTGSNLLPEAVIELAKHPNIVAIKEASGNIDQVSAILRSVPKNFVVLSGDDSLTLPMMVLGAKGVISTVSNIAPGEFAKMAHSFLTGDIEAARKIHHKLFPVIKALFVEGNPVPLKAAMEIMGLCENRLRAPLTPASEQTMKLLKNALSDAGLI